MYISMNWIGDFVDLSGLDLESLIHRFTLSTAEVEDIFHKGEDLRDVVAGKILSVEAHPNSKKLHLLQVDAGNKIYDVVCGAPNVREGMIVPFVKEGAWWPARISPAPPSPGWNPTACAAPSGSWASPMTTRA